MMKSLLSLLLLVFLSTCVCAQTTPEAVPLSALPAPHEPAFSDLYQNAPQRGPVNGVFRNIPDSLRGKLEVKYTAASINYDLMKELSTPVAEDGSFALRLPENYPATRVVYQVENLFISSFIIRTEIALDIDYTLLDVEGAQALQYTGEDALLAKTVIAHRDSIWSWDKELKYLSFNLLLDKNIDSANKHAMLDSVYTAYTALDELFIKRQNVPVDIASILRNERETEYLYHLTVVYNEGLPDPLKPRHLDHRPLVMSYNTMGFYDNFYYSLHNAFLADWEADTTTSQQTQNLALVEHQITYLDANFEPARADLQKLYLKNEDPDTDAQIAEQVLQSVTTPWVAGLVRKRRDDKRVIANRISAILAQADTTLTNKGIGQPVSSLPFGADLFTASPDITAAELIGNLRAAFPGKALYLDFWAVWCGPCLGQFPHSARLHGEAHDLPVEFVYLCTEYGGDQKRWQQKIAENELPGTHLFLSRALHAEMMDLFDGKGYPTYAVVKSDGKVKNNVRRPSALNRDKLQKLIAIK